MVYLSLFLSALLAATLIPAQSEGLLIGLLLEGSSVFWGLILAASMGNTLGSVVNWFFGRYLHCLQHKRWSPVSVQSVKSAEERFRKLGLWSLLLSWVPIIGDPITVVAGFLRVRFVPFLLLVAIAKTGRYLVISLPVYWYQY